MEVRTRQDMHLDRRRNTVDLYSMLISRYRVKSLAGPLNQRARAVKTVYKDCDERQNDAHRYGHRRLSKSDLSGLKHESNTELRIHSGTCNALCKQYAKCRSLRNGPCVR